MAVNALTYIKNVGKSFGYSAIDTLKEYNPAVVEAASQAKSLSSDLYQSIKDFKTSVTNTEEESFVGQAKDAIKEIWKSTKEDLASGKWYNKQRIDKNQEEMMSDLFGGDFDMSFDFDDDFGDDMFSEDDFEDEAKSNAVTEMQSARAIVSGVDAIAAKTVGAVNSATVKSAEYVAGIQERSAKALYNLNERNFLNITKGIGSISASMNVVQSLAEPLTTHMQNSATFYTKSTEYQDKVIGLLEEIKKNTVYEEDKKSSSGKGRKSVEDFMSGGVIDLKEYMNMVKGNMKEYTDIVTSLLDMFGGVKGAGKMAAGSPLSMITTAIMGGILPKGMKNNMKDFNNLLEDAMYTFLGTMKDRKLPGILDLFSDILIPDFSFKDSINPNNFKKGKMPWDGVAKHALVNVIPAQLSKIVSALTGEDRQIFDYRTGRWKKIKYVRGEIRERIKSTATSNDLNYAAKSAIGKQQSEGKISKQKADQLGKEIDEFMTNSLTSNNSDFMKFMNNDFYDKYGKKYGLSKESWNLLRAVAGINASNGNKHMKTNFSSSIIRGRSSMNNVFDSIGEEAGIEINVYNGDYTEDEEKKEKAGKKGSGLLSRSIDDKGHDIFFYLQGIYQYTQHLSDNIGNFGGSGGKKKKSKGNGPNGPIAPIRDISVANTDEDKNSAANKNEEENFTGSNNVLDNIREIVMSNINSVSDTVKFSSRELEDYVNRRNRFLSQNGGNVEAWKSNGSFDDKLEEKMEKEIRNSNRWKSFLDRHEDSKLNVVYKSVGKFFESISNMLNIPTKYVAGFYDSMSTSINNALFGEGKKGGVLDFAKNLVTNFSGTMADIANGVKNALYGKVLGEVEEEQYIDKDGRIKTRKRRKGGIASKFLNASTDTLKDVGAHIKRRFGFAKGGVVTKTGLATLSAGEIVIPTDGDKNYEAYREAMAAARGTEAEGEGLSKADKKRMKDQYKYDTGQKMSGKRLYEKGFDARNVKDFALMSVSKLFDGIKIVTDSLVGEHPKEEMDKVKKDFDEKAKKVLPGIEEGQGGIGAGAVLGGGLSILTGGLVNPLLGAGLGAAVGLIKKSEVIQKLLFGEGKDQTDLQKKMQSFILDKVPTIAEGAGYGGTIGLFMGSPLLGSILGGTVGFIASSDKAKEFLFGREDEDGLFTKEAQAKIKKAIPNIGAGALAGLIAGPFGLAGNIILGSAIGYASSTDKFKNWLFGEEIEEEYIDEKGNKRTRKKKQGGLVEGLRESLANPLVDVFTKLSVEIKHDLHTVFTSMGKMIKNVLASFKKNLSENFLVRTLKKTGIGRFIGKVAGGIAGLPGRALSHMDQSLGKRALKKGFEIYDRKNKRYMTSDERLAYAESLGIDLDKSAGGKITQTLAGLDDEDRTELETALSQYVKDPDNASMRLKMTRSQKKLKSIATSSSNSDKQNEEIEKYFNKELKKLDKLSKAVRKEKDPTIRAQKKEELDAHVKEMKQHINETEYFKGKERLIEELDKYVATANQFNDRELARESISDKFGLKGISDLQAEDALRQLGIDKADPNAEIKKQEKKEKEQEKVNQTIFKLPEFLERIIRILKNEPDPAEEQSELGEHARDALNIFKGGKNDSIASSEGTASEESGNGSRATDIVNNSASLSDIPQEGNTKEEGGKTMIFHNGEWIVKEDYEQDKSFKAKLMGIPALLGSIFGKDGLFGKLFGEKKDDEKEKKPNIFEMIFDKLFTAKDSLMSTIKDIFGIGAGQSLLSGLLSGFATTILPGVIAGAVFSGKLDDILSRVFGPILNKFSNDTKPVMDPGAKVLGGKQIQLDASGNDMLDENGNYILVNGGTMDKSGNVYDTEGNFVEKVDVNREENYGTNNSASHRAINNAVVQATRTFAKTGSVAAVANSSAGVKAAVATGKAVGGFVGKIIQLIKSWATLLKDAIKGIAKYSKKVAQAIGGAGEKQAAAIAEEATEKFAGELTAKAGEYEAKAAATGSMEISKTAAQQAAKVAYIAMLATAFVNGFGNAPSYMGTTESIYTMSLGQKLIAAVINTLNNAIPFIGGLIPTKVFYDVFLFVAKKIWPDAEWIKEWDAKRAAATAEVEAFNAAHPDLNFNIEQYNQYMHNCGIVTDVGGALSNDVKTVGNTFKNEGFGTTMANIGKGFVETVKDEGLVNTLVVDPIVDNTISRTFNARLNNAVDNGIANGSKLATGYDKAMTGVGTAINAVGAFTGLDKMGDSIAHGRFIRDSFKEFNRSTYSVNVLALKGEVVEMFAEAFGNGNDDDGNPLAPMQKAIKAGQAILMSPIALTVGAVKMLWNDGLKPAFQSMGNGVKDIINGTKTVVDLAFEGKIGEMFTTGETKDGEALGILGNAAKGVVGVAMLPVALGAAVSDPIVNAITSFKDKIVSNVKAFGDFNDQMWEKAMEGDTAGVLGLQYEQTSNTGLGWVFEGVSWVGKILGTVVSLVMKIVNPIKETAEKISNEVADKVETLQTAGDMFIEDYKNGNVDFLGDAWDFWTGGWGSRHRGGRGSRLAGRGQFVSQMDPRYANMSVGGDSVADAGCAPAAASMVASQYGKNLSMKDAVGIANGYQNANGTTVDYFGSALGNAGVSTYNINSRRQVYDNIRSGNPVILLGQDGGRSSKSTTPFGPGSHYVVATGMDSNGNVIVNDPEAKAPRRYSPKIMNSVKAAIGTMPGGGRSKSRLMPGRRFRSTLGGRATNGSRAPEIWTWLHQNTDLNDIQIAAIMGCWQAESNNNPKRLECDYIGSTASEIDWNSIATPEGLDDYCLNKVFPRYKTVRIDKESYYHNGHYYPGMGLAQWTGSRTQALCDFAAQKGRAWYDLEVQLEYFMYELTGTYSKTYSKLKNATTFEDAVEAFGSGFEHPGLKRNGSLQGEYWKRVDYAKTLYNELSGQPAVNISSRDNAVAGSSGFASGASPIDYMLSVQGQLQYSQTNRDPEKGSADCSSTVRWAIMKAGGPDIGGYSGAQYNNANLTPVWYNNGTQWPKGSYPEGLQPNDVLFFRRSGRNTPDSVGHVGLYLGNGQYIDHGSGMGPKIKNLANSGTLIKASRLNGMAFPASSYDGSRYGSIYRSNISSSNFSSGSGFNSANVSEEFKGMDVLSAIQKLFNTAFSNAFNLGGDTSSTAGYSYGGNYSSSTYESSYTPTGISTPGERIAIGDNIFNLSNAPTWQWDRKKAVLQPNINDPSAYRMWEETKRNPDKYAQFIAGLNGRDISRVPKLDSYAKSELLKAGKDAYVDYMMERSLPLESTWRKWLVNSGESDDAERRMKEDGTWDAYLNKQLAGHGTVLAGRGTYTSTPALRASQLQNAASNQTTNNIRVNATMDKTSAMMLKAIIALVETLVSNTSKVENIYELLAKLVTQNGQGNEATAAAIAQLSASNNNNSIDAGLQALKETVDSILAS